MSCSYPYFMRFFLKHWSYVHYCVTWDFITTKLSFWGTVPPSFRDTILGLAVSLIKFYAYIFSKLVSYQNQLFEKASKEYWLFCSLQYRSILHHCTNINFNWTDILAVSGNTFVTRAANPHPYDTPTFKTNAFHLVSNVYGESA